MEKQIVRSYNLFQFLYVFPRAFVFVTYVLFLQENKLNFTEIGWVNFVFMVAVFIFEVPTGVVADYFGRKTSIIIGMIIETGGLAVYFLSSSFWGFVGAEIILAFGLSFVSGALDAWVKDSLDVNGSKQHIGVVFSQGNVVSHVAMIFGGGLGGIIGNYSLRLPWLAAAILSALSVGLAIKLLDESYFVKRKFHLRESLSGMKVVAQGGIRFGYSNKGVWSLILISAFYATGMQAVNMQWSVLFAQQFGLASVGLIWIVASLFCILGSLIVGLLIKGNYPDRRLLSGSIIVTAVGIFFLTLTHCHWLILSCYFVHELGRGAFLPIQGHCLQNKLARESRATITSFHSMVTKVGAAIGWLGMGYLADISSLSSCWQISSLFFLIALWCVGRWKV